ncbi:LrgB family protein [Bacillus sp. PS06]|uniref:LrgB family protein n=1 Tax=Bacillus sp. PS06 TaxID=2764176 RepID=UPI0017848ADF|nr:LrgB family protein [Bacillus sp. PS06]MBD8069022.1 LrgB family protein [Bacillus sp. PS06]
MNLVWGVGTCVLTIVLFQMMKLMYQKYHYPLLVPIATTTTVIILLLLLFNIPYETYMLGGSWIGELLGPAVVALAFPLYQNKNLLKKYFTPIMAGVFIGSTIGLLSGLYLALMLQIDKEIIISLIPKSVTTPIAMDIASISGGIPTMAAVFVTVAGVSGAMFGPSILKLFRITHYIGIGVGFGTASHGIGTARALEIGQKEAAISSISMIISAVFAAIVCPILIKLLL